MSEQLVTTPEEAEAEELTVNGFEGASMLHLTDKEIDLLAESVTTEQVDIRPDGLIYLPQVFYRQKLNDIFHPGEWVLVERWNRQDGNVMFYCGALFIRGCFVSQAVGEAKYFEGNEQTTWASAYESAKSDCLTRCCKDLGIAKELWQPRFIETWIKDNAVKKWNEGSNKKNKWFWRHKDAEPFFWEKKSDKPPDQKKPEAKPALFRF